MKIGKGPDQEEVVFFSSKPCQFDIVTFQPKQFEVIFSGKIGFNCCCDPEPSGLFSQLSCKSGSYSMEFPLDSDVCENGDPTNTTYCSDVDIFFSVSGCDNSGNNCQQVEISGFSAPCGKVIGVNFV